MWLADAGFLNPNVLGRNIWKQKQVNTLVWVNPNGICTNFSLRQITKLWPYFWQTNQPPISSTLALIIFSLCFIVLAMKPGDYTWKRRAEQRSSFEPENVLFLITFSGIAQYHWRNDETCIYLLLRFSKYWWFSYPSQGRDNSQHSLLLFGALW